MNEHTTIDPTTGIDNSLLAKQERYAELDRRLALRKATETWADKVDLAPIRHTTRRWFRPTP